MVHQELATKNNDKKEFAIVKCKRNRLENLFNLFANNIMVASGDVDGHN